MKSPAKKTSLKKTKKAPIEKAAAKKTPVQKVAAQKAPVRKTAIKKIFIEKTPGAKNLKQGAPLDKAPVTMTPQASKPIKKTPSRFAIYAGIFLAAAIVAWAWSSFLGGQKAAEQEAEAQRQAAEMQRVEMERMDLEKRRIEAEQKAEAERKKAEKQLAEAKQAAEAAAADEAARIAEALRAAEEARLADAKRQAEEKQRAKAKSQASEASLAKEPEVKSGPKAKWLKNQILISGGPYTLVDHNGKIVADADFHGGLTLVSFGYITNCQDCLAMLGRMERTLKLLGDNQKKVTPIFISVDPERDSPESLKEFLSHFGGRFLGLTGAYGQIEKALGAFRTSAVKIFVDDGDENEYSFEYPRLIYLMGPDGQYRAHFDEAATPEDMAGQIKEML